MEYLELTVIRYGGGRETGNLFEFPYIVYLEVYVSCNETNYPLYTCVGVNCPD